MGFPASRPRRLRATPAIRRMVRETAVTVDDLVLPLFAVCGQNVNEPVASMPGVFRQSPGLLAETARRAWELGIPAVLLFGLTDQKDAAASQAWNPDGAVQQAIKSVRETAPEMTVITDVCLCAYTANGHCGFVTDDGVIDNDRTLEALNKTALSHARAGADIVAPSDMMDGRVGSIRGALDIEGFTDTAIMSYAVKYSSAYYGPFRDAAGSAPSSGDRKSHQMDPANSREAIREALLDVEEGADIIMVKPALAYLDIIGSLRERINLPLAAYNVSGEYSMVKAAAEKGWIDERAVVTENLTAMKRAGADIIITYHAQDAAKWLSEERK